MKYKICLLALCLTITFAKAQTEPKAGTKKENARLTKLKAKGTYPLIKASPFSGVLPVTGITEKPDVTMKYKLVISLTNGSRDGEKVKEINHGLAEIGRIINLHIAAGIPKQNLEVVIVAHSFAVFALLNNEAFKKEFKTDNPNTTIISELEGAGAKFIVCGQSLQYQDISNESIMPTAKIAMSAKTSLSNYMLKGYVLYEIGEE